MGIGIFRSFSQYDKESNDSAPPVVTKFPNPNPSNFVIEKSSQIMNFLILQVRYPDCTNYEGRKILVYKGVTEETLLERNKGTIDPHFSNNPKFFSPIARFVPDNDGWTMAKSFVLSQLVRQL